jgi:two-component system, OmpR family, KDP operon response regulator KdpE
MDEARFAPAALVVEDEPEIRRFVRQTLVREGFRVAEAEGVTAALVVAADKSPDLVILDLGLVDGDGLRFIEDFRLWSQRPILVLSARQGEQDKVAALDAGADDFLTKPFSVAELLARLRALLRRSARQGRDEAVFRFGDVEVDLARRQVRRAGLEVHLTALEFRLLAVLLVNAGKVMTHRQLLREVWGAGHSGDSHYLRIYVGHLRQKLEREPALPVHLLTEIGVGYRFLV